MDQHQLMTLLTDLYNQKVQIDQVYKKIKDFPFEDLGHAKIDHHRALRKGYPEVIFCQNKTSQQIIDIVKAQIEHDETVFGTRASPHILEIVNREVSGVAIDPIARCFWKKSENWKACSNVNGEILICSAGTADLPVAMEAQRTIEILGHPCTMLCDVGVAGIHRLFSYREKIENASVIITVAGMEGALPSVVAGYVSCPVIGVPTSVGYGSHLNGMVPLFAMLNSCASGLTVVNIDNGFGAACAAVSINKGR